MESLAYFVLVCSDTSVHSRSRLTAGWFCVDTLGYFVLVCSDTSVHSRSRLTTGWYCVDTFLTPTFLKLLKVDEVVVLFSQEFLLFCPKKEEMEAI